MEVPTSANAESTITANTCPFCSTAISRDGTEFKEIRVWVSGPKSDGAVLREETGRYAHKECVDKVRQGQSPNQPTFF